MAEEDADKFVVTFSGSRPEYLKRIWDQRVRESGRYDWPSLPASETAEIETVDQAWERLVGELMPSEWLDLGGPETLYKLIRYLDPDEMHTIRGPYAVKGEAERNRLGTLLWRRLVLQREAARSR
jgi:hypothetical protein